MYLLGPPIQEAFASEKYHKPRKKQTGNFCKPDSGIDKSGYSLFYARKQMLPELPDEGQPLTRVVCFDKLRRVGVMDYSILDI